MHLWSFPCPQEPTLLYTSTPTPTCQPTYLRKYADKRIVLNTLGTAMTNKYHEAANIIGATSILLVLESYRIVRLFLLLSNLPPQNTSTENGITLRNPLRPQILPHQTMDSLNPKSKCKAVAVKIEPHLNFDTEWPTVYTRGLR